MKKHFRKKALLILTYFCILMHTCIAKEGWAQSASERTNNKYDKAMFYLEAGKTSKAVKLFQKLIDKDQHGKSLFQLSRIELERDGVSDILVAKLTTARRLMQEEEEYIESHQGSNFEQLNLLQLISDVDDLLHVLGVNTPEEIVEMEIQQRIDEDSISKSDDTKYEPSLSSDNIFKQLSNGYFELNGLETGFFKKGEITTFYQANDSMPIGYRLLQLQELEDVLTGLLSQADGRQLLKQLPWEYRSSLKFISDEIFFDDENNPLVRGFLLKLNKLELETKDIDPGDSAVAILIKMN